MIGIEKERKLDGEEKLYQFGFCPEYDGRLKCRSYVKRTDSYRYEIRFYIKQDKVNFSACRETKMATYPMEIDDQLLSAILYRKKELENYICILSKLK